MIEYEGITPINRMERKVKKMRMFDVVKQLELDVFCDVMFGAVKDFNTQDELKAALQEEISEEVLQRINEAALREGYQPLSFSG